MPIKEMPKPVAKTPEAKNIIKKKLPAKKVSYEYIGKESPKEILRKSIPERLIPTKNTAEYFGWIFLVVILLAFFQFPFGSLLSGNVDVDVGIGYPMHFFVFNISEPSGMPLRIKALLIDMLIYLFIAYSIEIIMSSVKSSSILKTDKEKKSLPKIFQNKKTVAEKVTEKVIEKTGQGRLPKEPAKTLK